MDDAPTQALRARSPALLLAGLRRVLVDGRGEWLRDWRDLLMVLAPYHDCARRLDVDPTALFDEAAEDVPELRDVVRRFGRRHDVTPEAFAFELVDEPDGPRYRFV